MCRVVGIVLLSVLVLLMNGCTAYNKEETSLEISYEVLENNEIPTELIAQLEEKKTGPIRMTYETSEGLYIAVGYGEKEQEGYEISVDSVKSSDHFVYIHTTLTGPREEAKQKIKSYPYLVIKCQQIEKQVIFLN